MSKGPGRIERRLAELFETTTDRALSVGDLARHAFALAPEATPDRKQRLSTTRAAHRMLKRAGAANEAIAIACDRVVAEATAQLGRGPIQRGRGAAEVAYCDGRGGFILVDRKFSDAMKAAPSHPLWRQAFDARDHEEKRLSKALLDWHRGGWRTTETADRRLWFHPANHPVRIWAATIRPEGVAWADAELVRIDNTYVWVRYQGESARLGRDKLAHGWTIYRNVFFTTSRSGRAAGAFDEMWQQRYGQAGAAPPPALQMPLAEAIRLLGVPADFSREDVIAAFRRQAMRCHPDQGGSEAQFIALVKARDRLLAALGSKAAAPKMPEFAPKGARLRYRTWRPGGPAERLGQSKRLAR